MLRNNRLLKFPWSPFVGTIGTAPELEAISSLTPFDQGGNMDDPATKPGNKSSYSLSHRILNPDKRQFVKSIRLIARFFKKHHQKTKYLFLVDGKIVEHHCLHIS